LAPVTEFKLTRADDVALVTIDNGEDWTKPTFFGRRALESLERLLVELENGDFRAAVITGKPFVFAAGADITEFPDITAERAIEGARAGHELFGRLRALPLPTVAESSWLCTALRERSRPGFATLHFPRSSSASSPPGAERSFYRGSSGRRPRSR
jgi:enoyl-CoA hydratase/carnithine racemase